MIDLYILFEAIRTLGGLRKVFDQRLFFHIRQILLIPEAASNYAWQLSQVYKRFCFPCHDDLLEAVTAAYKKVNLCLLTPRWLNARMDLPESSPSTETAPSGGKSSPCTEGKQPQEEARHGRDNEDANVEAEDKEERDFLLLPEATQAAVRARMNANQLEPLEIRHRLFHGIQSQLTRLDIRNHIIRMWYRNPRQRLLVHTAVRDVPLSFHDLAVRVFTVLECAGAINFGAVPFMTPYSMRYSIQGERKKRICIVGAGISGLIAARQLRSFGFATTVFEARERVGGRIYTETSLFSAPVDLGAMIITGVNQNPLSVLASQTFSEMHHIRSSCPLFDVDGHWVPPHADKWAEREYNCILSATDRYRKRHFSETNADSLSLGHTFQKSLMKRVQRRKERIHKIRKIAYKVYNDKKAHVHKKLSEVQNNFEIFRNGREEGLMIAKNRFSKEDGVSSLKEVQVATGGWSRHHTQRRKCSALVSRKSNRLRNCSQLDEKGSNSVYTENSDQKMEHGLKMEHPKDDSVISRLLRWHIANLEYACAARIESVSLKHWDQDDPYAFQGDHVLLKDGFGPLVTALTQGLERNIRLGTEVVAVRRSEEWGHVVVETVQSGAKNGPIASQNFDAVLITVPLGVLKSGSIAFDPPLPSFKQNAINRLGCGGLMKVAMEFGHRFWTASDMFGALREVAHKRGLFYFFWNMSNCLGKPILLGIVAEPSVGAMEQSGDEAVISEAMKVLRRRYPDAPEPVKFAVTRWSDDPYARGAYSNIPVGSSGIDYDELAEPVEPFIFFAGEHTCRTNPTTCASGLISGLREANRIVDKFGIIEHIADMHAACLGVQFDQSNLLTSTEQRLSGKLGRSTRSRPKGSDEGQY